MILNLKEHFSVPNHFQYIPSLEKKHTLGCRGSEFRNQRPVINILCKGYPLKSVTESRDPSLLVMFYTQPATSGRQHRNVI